jgi:hypothetical protein
VELRPALPSDSRGVAAPDGHEKTAALTSWFQQLFPAGAEVPILVGGAAAEIYSGGSYTSGDLDFVGEVTPAVAGKLGAAGFVRRGRHWVHEQGEVFFEFPGSALDPLARPVSVAVGKWTVRALSPEDILVDRLAAWELWSSAVDGIAAFRIWQSLSSALDREHLGRAAEAKGLVPALGYLQQFAAGCSGREPEEQELARWARRGP